MNITIIYIGIHSNVQYRAVYYKHMLLFCHLTLYMLKLFKVEWILIGYFKSFIRV